MKVTKAAALLFIGTAITSPVSIAHLSFKGEVMPTASAPYNWTGYYAGLNLGAVEHTLNVTDDNAVLFLATIQQSTNPKLTGGLQIGYRRQLDVLNTSGVYGAEFSADFSASNYNKTYGSAFALYQLNSSNSLNNQLMLQLIGGLAANRTLLFLAAGLSWVSLSGDMVKTNEIAFVHSITLGKNAFGTALGGGIEYAFTDKISGRFKVDVITPFNYTSYDNTGSSFTISNNIVQGTIGVNYKIA